MWQRSPEWVFSIGCEWTRCMHFFFLKLAHGSGMTWNGMHCTNGVVQCSLLHSYWRHYATLYSCSVIYGCVFAGTRCCIARWPLRCSVLGTASTNLNVVWPCKDSDRSLTSLAGDLSTRFMKGDGTEGNGGDKCCLYGTGILIHLCPCICEASVLLRVCWKCPSWLYAAIPFSTVSLG